MSSTRRAFLSDAGVAFAAAGLVPYTLPTARAPRFGGGRFAEGVASGDPTPTGATLWTRVSDVRGRGSVTLEVARDRGFGNVVARRTVVTDGASGHAVKAAVGGLDPHEEYWYRFATRTEDSAVGRLRTTPPADSQQPVRVGFFSCQDYTHGYYNAHRLLAREDLDLVVCLGDYVYAETYHSRRGGTGVRDDRIGSTPRRGNGAILREAVSLADYRAKYRLYRSDPALRAVHAAFPMVVTWDDHEVQDNYAGGAARGGLAAAKRFSDRRRRNAHRAFFESMPTRATARTLYRSVRVGGAAELIVMDQRSFRADQPCGDAVVAPCAALDSDRAFLGRAQMDWVKQTLGASTAAWKLMANQVTIMPTRVTAGANFGYDTWTGYPREREELLQFLKSAAVKDVVFLTGDIHTFLAGDVRTGDGATGETVATEFVGGSITSSALGEITLDAGNGVKLNGNDADPATPALVLSLLRSVNPQVDNADFDHHGYGVVECTPQQLTCRMTRLATIKRRSLRTLPASDWTYVVQRGRPSVKGQHGPA